MVFWCDEIGLDDLGGEQTESQSSRIKEAAWLRVCMLTPRLYSDHGIPMPTFGIWQEGAAAGLPVAQAHVVTQHVGIIHTAA